MHKSVEKHYPCGPPGGAKTQLQYLNSPLRRLQVILLVPSEVQHVRSCPIDCATIYYNGVRRSGLYTVVPAHGGMPVEVYCDMDTDGQWPKRNSLHSGH